MSPGTSRPEATGSRERKVTWRIGPTAPAGKEPNRVQTIPGKSWFMILRLYGPLQPWFDQSWKPGDIEPVA